MSGDTGHTPGFGCEVGHTAPDVRGGGIPVTGRSNAVGLSMTCLACGGKGYLRQTDYQGLPYPVMCPACEGTGKQKVRRS